VIGSVRELDEREISYLFVYFALQEGREGRGKFAHGPQRMNPHASSTNKEKLKNKAFMMIKHNKRIKEKKKRSFRDKQVHSDCRIQFSNVHAQ
jgi:hypothetical protein